MKTKFIAFCLLLLLAVPAFSQKSEKNETPSPVEIEANVLVLDAAGQPVDDIKAEDLKIFENGVEQKIISFAKKERVLNAGLVMDNTGSLRSILEVVIQAGKTFVDNLRPDDEAFVIRFVSSDKIEVLEEWTNNKGLLKKALDNLYPEGGNSAVNDAIYLAANKITEREKKDSSKRYALVLISDGEDRQSYYKEKALFELLKKSELQVFTIGFVTELSTKASDPKKVENFVHKLALETGGKSFPIKKYAGKSYDAQVAEALKSIITELRSQYVVGYTSTNQKRDGLPRKLTVQITDGEKRQAVIRESFVVPENK